MDEKKDTNNFPKEETKKPSEQKLDDEELNISGGVAAAITVCPKCNKLPCECTNLV